MSRDLFYSLRVDSLDVRSLIESDHMPVTLTVKIYKCEQGVQKQEKKYWKRKAALLAANINDSSDFWKEVRTGYGERKPKWSKNIHRKGWFDHFQQLFSLADDRVSRECSELDDEVTEILDFDSDVLNQPIFDTDVRAAVSKLKAGKA